jgi:pimeloyl-ACP methyl ester carboxylesterase
MNGTVAPDDPHHSLALFMASRGVDFWALDYRTHFVSAGVAPNDLAELKDWTNAVFCADIDEAVRFIQAKTGRRRIIVAGFSHGVSLAYLYAAEHPQNVAGLLLFDGYIGRGEKGTPPAGIHAEDVAGKHLTWDKRAALLRLVIANPRAPAPVAKYKDAADNLNHVVYDSAGFGGKGGLANPLDGFSDPATLARVLITYDRYWPIVQDYEDPFPPPVMEALRRSHIPVLAFSSTNIAPDWADRVAKSAASTGSIDAHVKRLQGWGHLDVICGTYAARDVFAPALAWLKRLPE